MRLPGYAAVAIYFVGDDDNERNICYGIYPGVNPELVSQLHKLLREHNKNILELKAAVDSVPKGHTDFKVVINTNRKPSGEHQGRFNAPQLQKWLFSLLARILKREISFSTAETAGCYESVRRTIPMMLCSTL
ncbi:hypothetical protein E2320_003788 [Naja naja]|nr:hypothetical protein E2320_003788 [Naja naja]